MEKESNRRISRRQLIRMGVLGTLTAAAILLARRDEQRLGEPSPPIPIDEIIKNPDKFQNLPFQTSGYLEYVGTKVSKEKFSVSSFNVFSNREHKGDSIRALFPFSGANTKFAQALSDVGEVTFLGDLNEVSNYPPQMGVYQVIITRITEIQQ